MENVVSLSEVLSLLSREWRMPLESFSATPVLKGMSTASVFLLSGADLPNAYLKIEQNSIADLRSEIKRTQWLGAKGILVPSILKTFISGDIAAVLMTELPGNAPNDCSMARQEIIDIVARGIKAIHSLPAACCPFDETTAARLRRAHTMVDNNSIDVEQFDDRNRGLTAKHIYDRLLAAIPASNDHLVVIHGDPDFANLRIDPNGRLGFLDCGHAGRGDRYVDLVCIVANIKDQFGAEWVFPFLKSYGMQTWDYERALFFSDLYELF